jgi:hypothetical protein
MRKLKIKMLTGTEKIPIAGGNIDYIGGLSKILGYIMKYKVIYILFMLASILNSCSIKHDDNTTIVTVDVSTKADIDDFFKDYYAITLATEDECLIADIDKIIIDSDKIYILDRRNFLIYIFDIKGNYLNKLSKRGNGPGEYFDITDFIVVDSSIFVLSRVMKKILVYSENLDFIKNYPLDDFYDYCYFFDETLLLYSGYSNDTHFNIRMYNMEKEKMENEFLPFTVNQNFSFSPTPFNMTFNGDLLITQQYDYNVYKLEHDSLTVIFRFDFNTKDKIPDDFQNIGFDKVYGDLIQKSVVKRIEYINRLNDCFYITFTLDNVPYISQILPSKNMTSSLKLEFNDKFPFVFSKIIKFHENYLIGYMHAADVLTFDDKFPSNKTNTGFLREDDNPVLFFHKLREAE